MALVRVNCSEFYDPVFVTFICGSDLGKTDP